MGGDLSIAVSESYSPIVASVRRLLGGCLCEAAYPRLDAEAKPRPGGALNLRHLVVPGPGVLLLIRGMWSPLMRPVVLYRLVIGAPSRTANRWDRRCAETPRAMRVPTLKFLNIRVDP